MRKIQQVLAALWLLGMTIYSGKVLAQDGPTYFVAIHNEPFHDHEAVGDPPETFGFTNLPASPTQEQWLQACYDVLRTQVAKADSYGIKLTFMFTAQWVDFIKADPVRENELLAWSASGHEIGAHHHNPRHINWDGYTDMMQDESVALRTLIMRERGKPGVEGYLGTMTDYMAKLQDLNPDADCGCLNSGVAQGYEDLPAAITVDTCSGYATSGVPGRQMPDSQPEKGRNDYAYVGVIDGVERRWLSHFQTTRPWLVESAKGVFLDMSSGVFGSVNHSFPIEMEGFDNWLDFLHEQDPTGARSRTLPEVIQQNLLPEIPLPNRNTDGIWAFESISPSGEGELLFTWRNGDTNRWLTLSYTENIATGIWHNILTKAPSLSPTGVGLVSPAGTDLFFRLQALNSSPSED